MIEKTQGGGQKKAEFGNVDTELKNTTREQNNPPEPQLLYIILPLFTVSRRKGKNSNSRTLKVGEPLAKVQLWCTNDKQQPRAVLSALNEPGFTDVIKSSVQRSESHMGFGSLASQPHQGLQDLYQGWWRRVSLGSNQGGW